LSGITTTELVDAIQYFVFPNFFPWHGLAVPLVYRMRPNGNDAESCILEVMLMPMRPKDADPAPAAEHRLAPGESWMNAVELGPLREIFCQDVANMPAVQRGLRTTRKSGVVLARYHEMRIRWMHLVLDHYLNEAANN
jgi:hypothetical protein